MGDGSDARRNGGGDSFKLLRHYALRNANIKIVLDEVGTLNTSQPEYEWVKFLEAHVSPDIEHAWNVVGGQRTFSRIRPDGFSQAKATAYFLNGCHIHGHWPLKDCDLLPKHLSKSDTNCFHQRYDELHMR